MLKAFIAIDDNRLEDAINTYKDMVKFLFIRYSRKDNYETIIDTDAITNPKILTTASPRNISTLNKQTLFSRNTAFR